MVAVARRWHAGTVADSFDRALAAGLVQPDPTTCGSCTLVVARILVPADFGLVAMATAFSQSVDAFSEVGLRDALVRHPEEASGFYDTAFTMQVVRGFLTCAVVALAAPFAGYWFGEPRLGSILLVLAALAAASGFENIAIAEFRRNFRFGT